MALSPNYGWTEPDNTGLVKNGAQDMRTLGDAIDTSVWNVGFGQAGKNKVINGDFGIWQRGTSFTATGYTADRYFVQPASGQTVACSRQTFTPGAAPIAGYEGQYFYRFALSGTPSGAYWLTQKIEDVRTFAGQPVTLSFWAKASTATSALQVVINQNFGSGGSGEVTALPNTNYSLTTSWQRFTFTSTFPSISGKTVGTGSFLDVRFAFGTSTINAINVDYFGLQVERGSKATPFQTASGGSPQAELAMCQRYYQKSYAIDTAPGASFPGGYSVTIVENNIPNTNFYHYQPLIVQTRVAPTVSIYSAAGTLTRVSTSAGSDLAANSAVATSINDNHFSIQNSSGAALTASAGGFIFFYVASAEL
jgi:hypothetical protein